MARPKFRTRESTTVYIREWKRRDRAEHPEKYKAIWAAERAKYREQRIAYTKAWRERNPERVKELNRLTHLRNPYERKSKQLRLVMRHLLRRRPTQEVLMQRAKRVKEMARLYREAHKAEYAAYRKTETYRLNSAVQSHRRRMHVRMNGGDFTAAEWRDKCALLGNVCIYCGEAKRLTIDHKIPLSRGGANDISNVVPACASCNLKKRAMTAHEFLAALALRRVA